MIQIAQGEWIADLGARVCRNISNGIIVGFQGKGNAPLGKIHYMPMKLLEQWAQKPDGYLLIQKTVMDAEEVFLRAHFENKIEVDAILY